MIDDWEPRLNALASYAYLTKERAIYERWLSRWDEIRCVIDSGAFTAWRLGQVITLAEYCNFIEGLPRKPWRYFALDMVHDPEGTWGNYHRMLDRGLRPVPIFTRGEKLDRLDRYFETSDVVGVGGLVGTEGRLGYINGIMKVAAGRRLHWLGVTNHDFIVHHRPYMCDSSTWANPQMYGKCKLYAGRGRHVTLRRDDCRKEMGSVLASILKSYGFSPLDLTREIKWRNIPGGITRVLGARSTVRYMLDLQRVCGTLMFAAENGGPLLMEAWDDEKPSDPKRRGGLERAGVLAEEAGGA